MKIPSRHRVELRLWLQHHSMQWRVAVFLLLFFGMQWCWTEMRGTAIERVLVSTITVKPAAALLNWLTPGIHVVAIGPTLRAPGGGLNILNGCEGMELMFMLAAAFIVAPLTARQRAAGFLSGIMLAWLVNQARILTLFYAWRSGRQLFDSLHGMIMPVMTVLVMGAYFHFALQACRPGHAAHSS